MDDVDRLLRSRWLPALCGGLAFGVVWFVWGSLNKLPIGTDEAAYLLQARIFASGRVIAPARPLSEFFQQYHVFVTPVLAAKYPPGHSLLLAPGIWLGLPGLMPALLVAVSAAILCSITRRFTSGATSILAVVLASTSEIALRFQASYFSEMTTGAMFAIAWWTLLRYWDSARARWLVACAVAVGWGAITRPLTMAAFGLPTAVCAWLAVRRHRTWSHVGPALAAGAVTVAIMFAWNARVVGDWRTMTLTAYTRLYSPTDDIGFGANPAPPAARLSDDQAALYAGIVALHSRYTAAAVPSAGADRAANIVRGTWSYGGLPGLFVLVGAVVLPAAITRMIVATLLCVFAAYLSYAHIPSWTLYYLEFQAPLALLTASGVWGLSRWIAGATQRRWPRASRRPADIQTLLFASMSLWLVAPVCNRAVGYRRARAADREYPERLERAVAGLPAGKSIVFIREALDHGEQRLVQNVPDLAAAPTWIVHDCGPDNDQLLARFPGRVAYVYWESISSSMPAAHIVRASDAPPDRRAGGGAAC
jgi:Dolichyl-phosphate-mannose-protein mannosyltransferase